jgi:hypothetical protein
VVGPERARVGPPRRGTRGAEHDPRAEGARELDRVAPDPARGRLHEHVLAVLQPCDLAQRHEGREAGHEQRAGDVRRVPRREREHARGVGDGVLRVSAGGRLRTGPNEREHGATDGRAADARPERVHLARDLAAGREGQRGGERVRVVPAPHDVGEVHGRGVHPHTATPR